MSKSGKKSKSTHEITLSTEPRIGRAKQHGALVNDFVHVFVDDQNLFWGIVNYQYGINYRIDFGKLLIEVSKDVEGKPRGVKSAYIAGIIPEDDSFWEIAKNKGFTVRRGYLGSSNRSKQDDAFLITEITSALYEQEGPSTIVLTAGDADYVPPLMRALDKGWRTEVAFVTQGVSAALVPVVHQFRQILPQDIRHRGKGYRGSSNEKGFDYV
jgi:uncharacterized LabA/DUF88 family protein